MWPVNLFFLAILNLFWVLYTTIWLSIDCAAKYCPSGCTFSSWIQVEDFELKCSSWILKVKRKCWSWCWLLILTSFHDLQIFFKMKISSWIFKLNFQVEIFTAIWGMECMCGSEIYLITTGIPHSQTRNDLSSLFKLNFKLNFQVEFSSWNTWKKRIFDFRRQKQCCWQLLNVDHKFAQFSRNSCQTISKSILEFSTWEFNLNSTWNLNEMLNLWQFSDKNFGLNWIWRFRFSEISENVISNFKFSRNFNISKIKKFSKTLSLLFTKNPLQRFSTISHFRHFSIFQHDFNEISPEQSSCQNIPPKRRVGGKYRD